jgi:hypothetical protein
MEAKHHLHTMTPRFGKGIVIAVVLLHTLLLAAYTFPEGFVPERFRLIGQWYDRPLFHQQWKLFAPDPPLCSCVLEGRFGQGEWSSIDCGPDSYLQRRTVQNLARHVQAEVQRGDTILDHHLVQAIRMNVLSSNYEPGRGNEVPEPEFRLVEQCIIDTEQPMVRMERITHLHTP